MSEGVFGDLELFLEGKASLKVDKSGRPTTRDLQIATTALLVEMAHVDDNLDTTEINALVSTLCRQFDISETHAGELIEVAEFLRQDRAQLRTMVKAIHDHFEMTQKQTVMAMLWKIMKADGLVTKTEATLASKVATALKLSREQVQQAQQMVEEGEV